MNSLKERTGDAHVADAAAAEKLAREMADAALRYAQMTEQLDRVMRTDRTKRRSAWRRVARERNGAQR